MVLQTCGNLFHRTQSGFVKKRRERNKRKKGLPVTICDPIFVAVFWLTMGLRVNILINHEGFLRLRLETLQVTLKFMRPFSEKFYFAHSLLVLLQSLSSFCRPKITIKANPLLTSYFPFSFFLLMCLSCPAMLSCHPDIYPESPFLTMTTKNPHSYPDDTTPIKC